MAAQPSQEEGVKIVVTGLNIFPIKSCKACKVNKIGFDSHGVVGDRRFMLIDGKNRFITQRKYPTLAMVEAVWVDCKDTGKKILKINAPRMKELVVVPIIDGPRIETTIWEDTVMTVDQGQEACEWFSSYLEIGSNIIRLAGMAEQAPGYTRTVSHLPPGLQGRLPPTPVVLTDRGPASIISNESLADLNLRLKERTGDHTVPLNRFRMNIEVTGCAHPFEEDEWLVIRIATTVLLVYVANERCKVTGINQDTAEIDKLGPLDILREYRAPAGPGHAKFGQMMIPLQKGGVIQLGDTVTVMDRKK